jgi:hypothetical protein
MKQPNRIMAAMRAGRKAYGYNLSFPSPWVIDILGKLDFDFVFIDGEHGPFGLDQLEDLCRTGDEADLGACTVAHITEPSGQPAQAVVFSWCWDCAKDDARIDAALPDAFARRVPTRGLSWRQ